MIEIARAYYDRTLSAYGVREFSSKDYENKDVSTPDVLSHLKWMCREIMESRVTGAKARAWIGYIQGELRAARKFNVNQLRMQTRECLGQEYVCGFAFHGSEVALVTKAKPRWQAGKLNGVGGKVEEGEGIQEAMAREWKEETGSEIPEMRWEHFCTLHTKDTRVHFFRVETIMRMELSEAPPEPCHWWAISNVLQNAAKIPNLNWLIPMARIQKVIAPAEVWE